MFPIHHQGAETIKTLQDDILRLQGFRTLNSPSLDISLGPLREAFHNGTFPLACMHEFLCGQQQENIAATAGFLSGLLSSLTRYSGTLIWISATRKLFPPALMTFGIEPHRFIFIDTAKEKDVLWAMNEALKCGAVTAVIGELREISFTESRRLQLSTEYSNTTGFILRHSSQKPSPTACVSRWRITPLSSEPVDDLPGIGFPKWKAELLRLKNGHSGSWDIQWDGKSFISVDRSVKETEDHKRNVG